MGTLTPVTPSPAEQDNTPTVFIDLSKSDATQLDGVKVGDVVKITLTGKVKSVSNSEGGGTVSIETKDVKVVPTGQRNPFDELADDD